MIIPVASDHAGFEEKEIVKSTLEKLGHMPVDFGTHSADSVDYPDFAAPLSKQINDGDHKMGILLCGSGQGVCMVANKYPNVRAALVYDEKSARLSRQHNNANVLCLPARELSDDEIKKLVTIWLHTDFDGGRHERRIEKIKSLTQEK